MNNWIAENGGLVVVIALYLIGYVIVKHFLKTFLINRSKKKHD